jgi:predicted MFS family arabinose efflux permease
MSKMSIDSTNTPRPVDQGISEDQSILPITAMVVMTVLAAAVFVVLPLLVGAIVEGLGFTAKQAGLFAGADMLGASVSALGISFIIPHGKWRVLLALAITILAIADTLSGLTNSVLTLIFLRVAGGVGEGMLLAIASAGMAETRNPDRVFGLATAGQLAFGSLALYFMPSLLAAYGVTGVFLSLAALTICAAPLIRHMPDSARLAGTSAMRSSKISLSGQSAMGLAGVFTYFMSQGGVWAYLGRIGAANQLATASIGRALAMSSIAGLLGASLSSWLGIRYGRTRPLVVATLCTVVSLLVFNHSITFVVYAAMVSLFSFAWNFTAPFQFGVLAQIDPSRRTVVLGQVVVFAGVALGPVVAASLITNGRFANVNWMGMTLCVLSLVFFWRVLAPVEQARLSGR